LENEQQGPEITDNDMKDMETSAKIEEVIRDKIDPVLGEHLGGIVLTGYSDGIAEVKFTGACGSCYAAEDTLDGVVKDILMKEIPEIKDIRLDNSADDDLIAFARKMMSKE